MVKEDKNLTGNARFEGFCIDLLKWIAGQVGFQYAIRLVPDHMYGVYDPDTKEWNGIVRELMEKVSRVLFSLFSYRRGRKSYECRYYSSRSIYLSPSLFAVKEEDQVWVCFSSSTRFFLKHAHGY